MKKQSFKDLLSKMEKLQETEEGKLKGGISTVNSNLSEDEVDKPDNYGCPENVYCPSED
ncbi:hypothetical protein [Zunongwangia sp. HGR-M22]|uniref:hypothetical protein n=1 Tax=Zunongwangia sp. HGR-M22 TaxID=3015168 RepID=UPI0022DD45BA|nr:hypothetical protein [Zunongwangia sp. HGR-M22]WBL25747.1 hypothetical protein PBT91_00295 [Zunongwangia sp. HGR-M22]